ncbi:39S ribosomal protein L17, mitochondrial [Trichinella spiralis]|uniref:Large ribosomal subunit protein bL17m n=2 Tax=Trichinella spiralis TaxID=6334 RepID=A0A0V1AV14_TRISP|nr:39S ribosomal protein L17, mitochondrial [Trichinella spiralis]
MSRRFDYGTVKTTVEKYARVFPRSLPSIKVPVSKEKIKLRHKFIKTGEGRCYHLKAALTSLFRDERIELSKYTALAVRPYAERLIQLAIEYGDCHKPTMETCDYWIEEKELIHKLFKDLVPRFENCKSSYTLLHRLPDKYEKLDNNNWKFTAPYILELKGNPYPPVPDGKHLHENSLLNVLLREAGKKFYSERRKATTSTDLDVQATKFAFVHFLQHNQPNTTANQASAMSSNLCCCQNGKGCCCCCAPPRVEEMMKAESGISRCCTDQADSCGCGVPKSVSSASKECCKNRQRRQHQQQQQQASCCKQNN